VEEGMGIARQVKWNTQEIDRDRLSVATKNIGIIVKGKLIVQGKTDELGRTILKEHQWNFFLEVSGQADKLEEELRSISGIGVVEERSGGWFLRCTKDVRPEVISLVSQRGLSLLQLRSEDPTLEEIYLKYFREA